MDRLDPQATPTPTPAAFTSPGGLDPLTGGVVPGSTFDPWSYRDDVPATHDVAGYKVEAADGGIGKVDSASHDLNAACLVVDTGPWIFGKNVLLPAGVVNHIDHDERKVYVDRTKDQIKSAPEFDPDYHPDPAYRDKIGGYYQGTYGEM